MAREDWAALQRAVHDIIPERSPLLAKLGSFFKRAGLVQEAVDAFCKVSQTSCCFSHVRRHLHYCTHDHVLLGPPVHANPVPFKLKLPH